MIASACKGKSEKKDEKPEEEDVYGDLLEKSDEPPESSPLGSLGMMSMLMGGANSGPGPYEALEESEDFDSSAKHTVVVEVSGAIVELRSMSLTGGVVGTELRKLVDHLRGLASEDNVANLVLRFSSPGIGVALAEEFATELSTLRVEFPKVRVLCHAESASNFGYLVMAACDELSLAPAGQVVLSGVAAVPMHMKGLLDKVGIEADFLHIGDYKGAAEPLTLERPSKQSNETTAMILDQAFATLTGGVALLRKLPKAEVDALLDTAFFDAEEAVEVKLVDRAEPYEAFLNRVSAGNWRAAPISKDENPMQKLMELAGLKPKSRPSGERVALVYAVGNVVDGAQNGIGGATSEIASGTLVPALEALIRDDDVKAVVIRVSSPGGSALASDVIWQSVERLAKAKPVIVSMGSVAASGGYYISAGAKKIFALENTLTGSIGVVGGKLATAGGMAKLGISAFPVGRGKHSLVFASPKKWSASDRDLVRKSMQAVYDQFAARVRKGRGEIADNLMQGRVWTGTKALEHKLVDGIGGLRLALAEAASLGGITDMDNLEVYPPEPTIIDMLGQFGVTSGVNSALLSTLAAAGLSKSQTDAIASVVSLVKGFTKAPVQAAWLSPLVLE